jgi:transposase-like protein
MKRSKYTDEQILAIVKEGEAGRKVADLCRANGITEQTYYRWNPHLLRTRFTLVTFCRCRKSISP